MGLSPSLPGCERLPAWLSQGANAYVTLVHVAWYRQRSPRLVHHPAPSVVCQNGRRRMLASAIRPLYFARCVVCLGLPKENRKTSETPYAFCVITCGPEVSLMGWRGVAYDEECSLSLAKLIGVSLRNVVFRVFRHRGYAKPDESVMAHVITEAAWRYCSKSCRPGAHCPTVVERAIADGSDRPCANTSPKGAAANPADPYCAECSCGRTCPARSSGAFTRNITYEWLRRERPSAPVRFRPRSCRTRAHFHRRSPCNAPKSLLLCSAPYRSCPTANGKPWSDTTWAQTHSRTSQPLGIVKKLKSRWCFTALAGNCKGCPKSKGQTRFARAWVNDLLGQAESERTSWATYQPTRT